MFINEGKNVKTCPGIVLWDGITSPETKTDGAIVHSLKIAIPANSAEKGEIEQLATQTLQASEFKGNFPAGGEWPLREIDLSKFGDGAPLLAGRVAINANTRRGAPAVFDVNGQELSAMQYGRMLYPGAVVELLVHCYSFNNKSKGLALGLDGIRIVDATTPRLPVGGGMAASEVAAAFGAGGGGVPQTGMPQTGMPQTGMPQTGMPQTGMPPVTPHTGFVTGAAAGTPPPPPAAGHVMTPKAQGATYEQMIAGGWTDALLIQHGMMTQ